MAPVAAAGPPLPALSTEIQFGSFNTGRIQSQAELQANCTASVFPGAVADVTITDVLIAGAPDYHLANSVTGHVLANGEIVVVDSVTVSGPRVNTRNGVTVKYDTIWLSGDGAEENELFVYLPAGMGIGVSGPLDKTVVDHAILSNVRLSTGLLPGGDFALARSHFTGTPGSEFFVLLDRAPVQYTTSQITWSAALGEFSFSQKAGTNLAYHRDSQVNYLALFGSAFVGAPAPLRSNEGYFYTAKTAPGTTRVRARTGGGAALHEAEIGLDPNKYAPLPPPTFHQHFPRMSYSWTQTTGSRLVFANGEVDTANSALEGAGVTHTDYRKATPTASCDGTPSDPPVFQTVEFTPDSSRWRFHRDGGLHTTGSMPQVVLWGGYKKKNDATQYYSHGIFTLFDDVRASSAGVFGQVATPADLLLSGHGSPVDNALLERPGSPGYNNDGLADYPGLNLRAGDGTHTAISRLNDQPTSFYTLSENAKYLLREAGVSGMHIAAPGAGPSVTAFGGMDFDLTSIALSYCNGVNKDSGIAGSLILPDEAGFGLNFEKLMFGTQGQFLGAKVAAGQGEKTLASWGLKFTPIALNFPQPQKCPLPDPDEGFVSITAEATLSAFSPDPLTGTIDLLGDGEAQPTVDIVSYADAAAMNDPENPPPPMSSFRPPANVTVNGPHGRDWNVNPVTNVAISKHSLTPEGTLTMGGLMDVPFFEDMPVVISADSANGIPVTPTQYVRGDEEWEPITNIEFDASHRGRPTGVPLNTFRTDAFHHPVASKAWQDLIDFEFKLKLGSDGVFCSETPKVDDLFLFTLTQEVEAMTPDTLEMIFDGRTDTPISQVNVGSLLASAVTDPLRAELAGALGGAGALDDLLAPQLRDLLSNGLADAASNAVSTADLTAFAAAPNATARAALIHAKADAVSDELALLLGGAGAWTTEISDGIAEARAGIDTLNTVLSDLGSLATKLASKLQIGGSTAAAPDGRISALRALLAAIDKRLVDADAALNGAFLGSLAASFDGLAQDSLAAAALDDLAKKWSRDRSYTGGTANEWRDAFVAELSETLTDHAAGSDFAGDASRLLRQYLADPQLLARQAIDDTLRAAEEMLLDAIPGSDAVAEVIDGLSLENYIGAAGLRGYARVNGDSLNELRLDGSLVLKIPDDMNFDGWFLMREVDSSTPGSECLIAGGVVSEVSMGASAELDWGTSIGMELGGKVALDGNGDAVSISGDLGLAGEFDFEAVTVNDLKLGFGFGGTEGYLYGRAKGSIKAMDVEAGIFVGQTCDVAILQNADRDIGELVMAEWGSLPSMNDPVIGIAVYAEGGMSLMPLIGVPPSCLLDLRLHGGQGFFGFDLGTHDIIGLKMLQGVSGELLCIVDVRGDLVTVFSTTGNFTNAPPEFDSFTGSARGTLRGEIDFGLFSVGHSESAKFTIRADENDGVSYEFD